MKVTKYFIIPFILVAFILLIQYSQGKNDAIDIHVIQNSSEYIRIVYEIKNYSMEKICIDDNEYYVIKIGKEANIMEKGMPDLPKICRSIIIPDDKKMEIRVLKADYVEYDNISIAPSKGNLLRNVDPSDIPYEFGEIYEKDEWYPPNIAKLREPYILRDFRGQVVEIYPFQYNAIQKKLRVYKEIEVEIYANGKGEINVFKGERKAMSREFRQIYERHFINFGNVSNRYTPVEEEGRMLVICYDSFYSTMQPFVKWKNMKGIPCEIVNLSSIGSTANDIKNYITNYYNNYGLTFVLLVGDVQQIPTLYSGGGASDPSYSYVVGNDHYPDLFVGRFSAQDISQLETQVDRTIQYEKFPQANADWYHKGTGIASNEGAGQGDDGEADWQHMRNIRNDLMGYYYTYVDEFYDGSHGGGDANGNPTSTMVANAINNGRGIINYCGHGSAYSWTTSGFSISNIYSLANNNMLPFIWSVACNNGEFDTYDECFAEAWMRAENNDEPIGAIATFMSSRAQYWAPPMDAQDEMVDILVESYQNNIKHTIGGISYNGCMHMNDEYGSAGYDMTDTWILFGDPSLVVRTDTPTGMTVLCSNVIQAGATSLNITVIGVEDALCAVSKNGQLLAYNYTDEYGNTILYFEQPLNEGTLDLVVTAYNKIPYITTINVTSVNPPQISNISYTLSTDHVNITCIVKGDVDIANVKINITYPDESYVNKSMKMLNGSLYYCNTTCYLAGEYSFYIWAVDIIGNANITNVFYFSIGITYNLSLYEGWNLITLPIKSNYTASSLTASLGCSVILKWNASIQNFEIYVPGCPYDFALEVGRGYLVATKNEKTFSFVGIAIENVSIELLKGWNLLGWFKNNTYASSIFQNITACNLLMRWNNSLNNFDVYIPGAPDFKIKQGEGFFVAVDEESIWHGEG